VVAGDQAEQVMTTIKMILMNTLLPWSQGIHLSYKDPMKEESCEVIPLV
jgi:hypothetical protein